MPYTQTHWSLDELFSDYDDPTLQAAFDRVEALASSFEGARGRLKPDIDPQVFLDMLHQLEEIARTLSKMFGFAALSFSADTQDQAAQALQARVDQFNAKTNNRTLFFSLWWKQLDADNAQRLLESSGDYRYYLQLMRMFQPHTLSEPEEKIVNLKNVTGFNALGVLFDSIIYRYVFKMQIDGETKELTFGQLTDYRFSQDPEIRKQSYQEQFRVYGADAPILGQMYQAIVRDWHNENMGLRKFASPIAVRNLTNDIPDEAVDVLLEACRKNAPVFQRYFKLKARHIGMEKLRRYDIYAPVGKSDKRYDFEEGLELVFEAFRSFDPAFAHMARRVLDENHLDSEIRKGKDNGAFCAAVLPEMTPYVLASYLGRPTDVATIAHELGHAIHAMLAAEHSIFTAGPCMPLAETASTFGEMILTDKLLAEENDPAVRRELLFREMDDAYATILRPAYFAMFERQAHKMVQEQASVDDLSAAYLAGLKEQYGDSLELAEEFRFEWVMMPHIYHTPFYTYAYAFGDLLVFSLYKQYKAEGEAFKPRYLKILSAGGSQAPARVLGDAGIDLCSAAFWQAGFDVIDKLEEQLEQLPVEV